MMNEKMGASCGCGCHKMMGILVALFGLTFLLGALGVLTPWWVSVLWPIWVTLAGIKKMGMCKCCAK